MELFREGGIRELSRGIRDYIKHDLGTGYCDRRVDNEERWELISSHIDGNDQSLIDIGCAEGEFSARAAAMGLDVTALDRNVTRLETARTEHTGFDNLQFKRADLDPEMIDGLPETDVILFLTVHHHWIRAYGWDDAAEMFRTLLRKADTVIYEPPGHLAIKESAEDANLDPEDSLEYYSHLLESDFGDAARIVDTTITDHMGDSGRSDPVFVLDSSGY